MDQSIQLPEVVELAKLVKELVVAVQQLAIKVQPAQLWYSREDLARLKSFPVTAFYNKPWLLPGKPHKQNGLDRWSYQQVWESGWIWKSDADLNTEGEKRNGLRAETGIAAGHVQPPAAVLRLRRKRAGSHAGQPG